MAQKSSRLSVRKKESASSNYTANFLSKNDGRRNSSRKRGPALAWFMVVVVAGALLLGGNYIYSSITGSVAYQVPDWLKDQLNPQNSETDQIAALRETDTDQDGLNDYQEVYQYKTSMFLADTDSDGYSDFEETSSGEDPLCPRGQSCNLLQLITPKTKIAEVINNVELDRDLTLQDAVAAEFRKFLAANGVAQAELDKFSDEELLQLFEAVQKSNIIPDDQWVSTTTPDQVRAFLLSQPDSNSSEINGLSEQDLIDIRDKLLIE